MRLLKRWTTWAGLAGMLALTAAAHNSGPAPIEVTVWKSPTCGCCSKWVDHMRASGFTVVTHDTVNVDPVKKRLGVPADMVSCHTAVVNGYVIEGHVPAADIQKLLRDKPKVTGLAVPGMVAGSPGMEGGRSDPYAVVTFGGGASRVFARH